MDIKGVHIPKTKDYLIYKRKSESQNSTFNVRMNYEDVSLDQFLSRLKFKALRMRGNIKTLFSHPIDEISINIYTTECTQTLALSRIYIVISAAFY